MVYFPLAGSDCPGLRLANKILLVILSGSDLHHQNAWIYLVVLRYFPPFWEAQKTSWKWRHRISEFADAKSQTETTIHCHKKDQTKVSDCDCHRDFDSDDPYFQLQMGWKHCSHFRILALFAPQSLLGEFSGADRTHGFKHVRNMFKSWLSENTRHKHMAFFIIIKSSFFRPLYSCRPLWIKTWAPSGND